LIVWTWDADGPGASACGVTDDETRALADAEELLTEGRAETARVEMAYAHMGGLWIKSGYQRSGSGWTAVVGPDGSVRWTPFRRPALAAS
jgi:hypothetical protein